MARVEVTPGAVKAYLDRQMTEENYHLLYGLHLLSKDRFNAIMDALLNGEVFPEELIRLGSFTDAEADAFIKESLGGWSRPAVAVPLTGSDGYKYLVRDLGLGDLLRESAMAVPGGSFNLIMGSEAVLGGPNGHISLDEIRAIFRDKALPDGLQGSFFSQYFPSTPEEVMSLPIPEKETARQQQFLAWFESVFGVFYNPAPTTTDCLHWFLSVGTSESKLRRAPGLADWILTDPRPGPDSQLLLLREAAERNAKGPYTVAELTEMMATVLADRPDYVATGRKVSRLDFRLRVIGAAIAASTEEIPAELYSNYSVAVDALEAIFIHRDKLREFSVRAIQVCMKNIRGRYAIN